MKMLKLKRVSFREDGTFGVLLDENEAPFAVTLERPWENNAVGKSCIPTGLYLCKRVASPKFGNTFEVTAVAGRSHILFHRGNINDDTHGCILIGEKFEVWTDGRVSIHESGKGFGEFMILTADTNEFWLSISSC